MSGYKRAALTQTKLSPRSSLADLTMELDSTINTTSPQDATRPSKDSFDHLLKETAAELDGGDTIKNNINSIFNDLLTPRPFDISSFDAT